MSLLVQRPDVSEFRRRFRWLALVTLLAFLVLAGRALQLMIVNGEDYQAIARENIVRRVQLATTRGVIRDRNGEVLAASRPAYNLFVVPERITQIDETTSQPVMRPQWDKLIDYLELGEDERDRLEKKLVDMRRAAGAECEKAETSLPCLRLKQQILLKEDMPYEIAMTLETHASELAGIEVVPISVRYYPAGATGAHVLGYMREVDAEMLTKLRRNGYVEGDRIGAAGTERAWESYLRGTRGSEKIIVDARGVTRPTREGIIDEPQRVDPIPGRDLRLTIDAKLQSAMLRAMRGELAGGAALVDVRTGRILGLVSKPSYDPNELSGGNGKKIIRDAFHRLFNDPLKPAVDKTVSGAYPPGSTFKPFTALAALEKGLIDQKIVTNCRGFLRIGRRFFRCTQSHGSTDLHKAIAQSCNVYFYNLVTNYGVTMDMIAEMGERYGFGHKTGLGINAETSGRMPTRAWMTLRNKGQFRLGYTINAAIGQGATTSTVLQLALAYAALGNGGTLYQPQLVRAVETADGAVVQEFSPRLRRRIKLDEHQRKLIDRALWGGVNEVGGTSHKVRIAGLEVSGKTGSAQVSHKLRREDELENVWYFNRDHAWFAGYAPSQAPEVAVVVLIEHGGAGGKHAAPVAFEIIRAYEEQRDEERSRQHARAGQKPPTKPAGAAAPPPPGGTPQ